MTTPASLFATPAGDITIQRIRELVNTTPIETLTVEYKVQLGRDWVESVAAMVNSYGGLILIGVSDDDQLADRVVGVRGEVAVQVADTCQDALEPPWMPEVIPVPLAEGSDLVVLVLRVDPAKAPRPSLYRHRAPIRLHGRNAPADRLRMAQLFDERTSPARRSATGGFIGPKGIPAAQVVEGWPEPVPSDFMLSSGLILPLGEGRTFRPISDRQIDRLATSLDSSAIGYLVRTWCGAFGISGLNPFHPEGFNRANHARLVSQAVTNLQLARYPVEAVGEVALPDAFRPVASTLTFTLDFTVRVRLLFAEAGNSPPTYLWRLSISSLYEALDCFARTLSDPAVVEELADVAGIATELVGQHQAMHFSTGPTVEQILEMGGLRPIEGAGTSMGATLISDPALDLRNDDERRQQVNAWMERIGRDAGLRGMEQVVGKLPINQQAEPTVETAPPH